MPEVFKVALHGYNALTDNDPSHFKVFIDGSIDHVLVKEQSRGTTEVTSAGTANVDHDLGYYPFSIAMVEVSTGEFEWSYNAFGGAFNPYYLYVTLTQLVLGNEDIDDRNFTHVIFFDQI